MALGDLGVVANNAVASHDCALQHHIVAHHNTPAEHHGRADLRAAGDLHALFSVAVALRVHVGRARHELRVGYQRIHPSGHNVPTDGMIRPKILHPRGVLVLITCY